MLCIAKFFSTYKDALVVVTWVIGVTGWLITNYQSNLRERRKETRAEVDDICVSVDKILAACRTYYGKGPGNIDDDNLAAEIAFQVKRVVARVERLAKENHNFSDVKDARDRFFESITGEHFQSKQRALFGPDSVVMLDVEEAVHGLIDGLEEAFARAYK